MLWISSPRYWHFGGFNEPTKSSLIGEKSHNLVTLPLSNSAEQSRAEAAVLCLKEIIREISFKHCSSSFKPNFKPHSLNNAYMRISKSISSCKNRDLVLLRTVSSCLTVIVYWSRPCLDACTTLMVIINVKEWQDRGFVISSSYKSN
jgi:hypothetical protein